MSTPIPQEIEAIPEPPPAIAVQPSAFERMAFLPEMEEDSVTSLWLEIRDTAPEVWNTRYATEFRGRKRKGNNEEHIELFQAADGRRVYSRLTMYDPWSMDAGWFDRQGRQHGQVQEAKGFARNIRTDFFWHGERVSAAEYILRNSEESARKQAGE
jgi:hypothetical protein